MDLDKITSYLDRKADYWDVFYEESESFSITLRNYTLEKYQKHVDKGIGIRMLINGIIRYLSTETTEWDIIRKEIDRLANISGQGECKFREPSSIRDKYTLSAEFPENPEEELKSLTQKLQKGKIIHVLVSYKYTKQKTVFLNSEGAEIVQMIPRNRVFYEITAKENGKLESIYRAVRSLGGSAFEKLDDETINQDIDAVNALLKAKYIRPGIYDIVIDEHLAGVLAHEAYGHALEADHIHYKQSVLWNKFGEKLGEFTLIDSPETQGFGHYKYDDEGISGKTRFMIKEGVLQEKIEDMRFGDGGSGRRESYEYAPIPRMSNTYFSEGDWNDEELFYEIKHGYFLIGVSGGQVDTTGGTFQFDCKYCYEIKNGELGNIFKGTVFVGDILSTGKNITGIGNKVILEGGMCGKQSQGVPVGDGGPKILIKNAKLGGVE